VMMAVPFVMNVFASSALAAVNKAQSILSVAALQLAMTILLTWLLVPYGIIAVAAGYALRAWLTMPYQQYVLKRFAHIDSIGTLKAIAMPFVGSLVMAICVWFAKPVILAAVTPAWLGTGICIALGGIIYAAFMLIFAFKMIRPYLAMIMSMLPARFRLLAQK